MGQQQVGARTDPQTERLFTRAMLDDVRALERMLEEDLVEAGRRRAGAEQEMFLVDAEGWPAPVAQEILQELDDPRFTHELARFNLEANLPPMDLAGAFLGQMESELQDVLRTINGAARAREARVFLTGILPTLKRSDLTLNSMTPLPRYHQLNDSLLELANGRLSIFIRGVDELELAPRSVMFEAANTSFQLHLQVDAADFARLYNLTQLITAPLLAAAVASPLFLGRRLWQETRIALFERSVDARSSAQRERGGRPRVSFGSGWVRESVLELFHETIARFPVLLTCPAPDAPGEELDAGRVPKLSALMLHNGTVWRWNRPCYGVANGIAHLRIENRVLPSGPTVLDEVANAAFFYGLMAGLDGQAAEVPERISFETAKGNFIEAARQGLGAELGWLDGERIGARDLIRRLLPRAAEGLRSLEVPEEHVERYLGTLEARVESGRSASRVILDAVAAEPTPTSPTGMARLVRSLLELQRSGQPVHEWENNSDTAPTPRPRTLRDIMSTDLFTVRPHDLVDLATSVMAWKHFRHVPVETDSGELVGLVSHRALLRRHPRQGKPTAVESIMVRRLPRAAPDLSILDGLKQRLDGGEGCLLVVSEDRLLGIVTERDFLSIAAELIDSKG